jgi:rod shape determining protein RodA
MEHRVDPWLILAVIGIMGASLTTLHTVSRVIGTNLLLRQLLWGMVGLGTLWLLSRVRLDVFERLAPLLYGVGLIALVAVLVFGVARGGNRAWIAIGPLTIQPSEFVRLAVILMVAAWLANRRGDRLKTGDVVVAVLLVGIPVGLIILEPDLGVALTYLPILGGALWLGGLGPLRGRLPGSAIEDRGWIRRHQRTGPRSRQPVAASFPARAAHRFRLCGMG